MRLFRAESERVTCSELRPEESLDVTLQLTHQSQTCHVLDLRHQVSAGDGELLLRHVAGDVDDLHPVPQGVGDGVEDVGRAEEEDLGQIHGDVQIVVQEVAVLLRV